LFNNYVEDVILPFLAPDRTQRCCNCILSKGYTPYVLLPCGEELQGKVAVLFQGCAMRSFARYTEVAQFCVGA
jgi:hypothetical protein